MNKALTIIVFFITLTAHAGNSKPPSYITDSDFKKMLVDRIELPRKMDKDYHKKLKEREELIKTINSGALDKEAILATAQYNQSLAIKAGDREKAKLFAMEVASATKVLEAEQAAKNEERARAMEAFRQADMLLLQRKIREIQSKLE